MDEPEHFQLLVVAGGKGGKTLAIQMARAGWPVAMIERVPEMIGGTCINLACIPTKTLIRSAEVAELVRRAREFGVTASLAAPDATAVRERKRSVVEAMRAMNLEQFLASGMELIVGDARFVAPRRVEVATDAGPRLVEGEHAVIDLDLGGRPAVPPIPGLAEARPLTSETLLALERIPPRLLVLGGGYVGLELAQAMHQLLAREDADIAAAIAQILREDGIDVYLDCHVERVERAADGEVRVHAKTPTGSVEMLADDLLAALGRAPNTEGAGLDAAGVELDERGSSASTSVCEPAP